MTELLSYKTNFSRTLRIAYPVMLSQIGHIFVGIADSLMVGQLGPEPLAASSFANSVFSVFLMFGIGISFGITPLVAQAVGQGDQGTITRVLRQGIVLCAATGLLLLVGLVLVYFLLPYLGQTTEVVRLSGPYYLIIASSIIPLMLFQNFKQFTEGLSVTRQTMFITIFANLMNIGLNYLLIFGKLGFPGLGLNGAGWATLISRIFMMVAMYWFVLKGKPFRAFRDGFNLLKVKAGYFRPMLRIGVPAGTQFLFEVGAFSMAAVMMGWLGDKQLAAHQIAIGLVALSYMAATGISAAATVRIGNIIGQSDGVNLFRTGNANFMLSLFVMTACTILFVATHNIVPAYYIDDVEVIEIAGSLIIVAGFFQLSDGVQVVGLGNLRGMSDVKVPTLITFIAYWGLAIPVSYVFGFVLGFGPEGIWYGLLVGLTTAAVFLYFRFKRLAAKKALAFQKKQGARQPLVFKRVFQSKLAQNTEAIIMRKILTILFICSFGFAALAQNKETRNVGDFDEIIMRVSGKVLITQGNKNEVILEGDKDLLEEIETEVRGGRLNIKNERERWWSSSRRRERLTVYITVKKLRGAYISGSGDIVSQNTLKTDDFTASIAGSGDIEIALEADYIEAKISGSGNIELSGTSDRARLSISGSGKYVADKLEVGDYRVSMSGSGRGSINLNGDLDVRISGSGKIYYMGSPTSVNSSVSGSGSVRKIN